MAEKKQLFRKNSLEKIEKRENQKSVLRVLNPGVWVFLVAIIVALAGVIVWAVAGRIEMGIELNMRSTGFGGELLYVSEEEVKSLKYGDEVIIDGEKGKVTGISAEPVRAADVMDDYLIYLNGLSEDSWVFQVRTNLMCKEGLHEAKIITEQIVPINFIIGE